MNIQELLHKRILISEKSNSYSSVSTVVEIKILEIAPSGNWVKIQNMNGQKYWKSRADIVPIEILAFVDNPNKAN